MKKILFTIKPHSIVDVITNSSSELFVGKSQSKHEIIELIKEVYPDYLSEYDEVKSMNEMTHEELDDYFSYVCSPRSYPAEKHMYPIMPGFTFDELYQEKIVDRPTWHNLVQYELINNNPLAEKPWHNRFVCEHNFEEIKNKIDPKREMYFLYSIDENPDYDMQEKLATIMKRYHLG